MTNRRDLDDPEYKRIRAEILADEPVCHWCRRAKASTIDHLIEADRGGGHVHLGISRRGHPLRGEYLFAPPTGGYVTWYPSGTMR